MPRTITKAYRTARETHAKMHWLADQDDIPLYKMKREVPAAWYRIKHDLDVQEPKVRVTLMLDESVAKGFRSMGRGYQARINRILQTWLQLQILGHFDWDKVGDSILEENMDAAIAEFDEMERLQKERIKKGFE